MIIFKGSILVNADTVLKCLSGGSIAPPIYRCFIHLLAPSFCSVVLLSLTPGTGF